MDDRLWSAAGALTICLAAMLGFALAAHADAPPVEPAPTAPRSHAAARTPPRGAVDDMVEVPAGRFLMGCNAAVDSQCFDNEAAGHQVDLPAYRIDRTEVTVEQYRRCVDAGACSTAGLTMSFWNDAEQPQWAAYCNWEKPGRERHPINCLDWSMAKTYCEWAGKRLPSEAEWEKAARGRDGRKYPWGNQGFIPGHPVANIADESARREYPQWTIAAGYDDGWVGTAPVGSYPAGASPYQALDMIGNVWEWLADDFGGGRAVRGGSWSSPSYVRVSTRSWYDPHGRYERVGVRCVAPVQRRRGATVHGRDRREQ